MDRRRDGVDVDGIKRDGCKHTSMEKTTPSRHAHLPRLKTEPSTIVQQLQKQALKRLKKHRTKAPHQGSLNESNPAGTRGKECRTVDKAGQLHGFTDTKYLSYQNYPLWPWRRSMGQELVHTDLC